MIAGFDGQDYILLLNKDIAEINALSRNKLEAILFFTGKSNLEKKVILEYTPNGRIDNPDGIKISFLPETRKEWDDIQEIYIQINAPAYISLKSFGKCGTRYTSTKSVEIYNGDPEEY